LYCGRECNNNSPNDPECVLPSWRTFSRSDSKGINRKTLELLDLDAGAIQTALLKEKFFVNPGHYDEGAFWLSEKGWQIGAPSIDLPLKARVIAVHLDAKKLTQSNEKFQGYLNLCICSDPLCLRRVDKTNSVPLR
jgi:hypothetical protein